MNIFLKFIKKNWLIILIWLIGLFLRSYRQNDLLGFYYDQGRDAKMAHDILTGQNFPAIGPTTGIQGLYLGPFWFYLITPGYFIGQGDPAIASLFICFLESLSIPLIFYLLKKNWNLKSAYLGTSIWTFSYYLIRSSRWFSNPSPIPLFSLLIIHFLLKIYRDKQHKYWPMVALLLGLSLQLEAASAVFFIPIILILISLNFKQTFSAKIKIWIQSAFAFGILLLPQLAFEIKNNFLISKNFIGFLTGKVNSDTGKSWDMPTFDFFIKRLYTYFQTFFSKLDANVTVFSIIFLIIFIIGIFYLLKKHFSKNFFIQILILWLFVPLFFLIFFVGNFGNLYDYYLTGFFSAFVMLMAIILVYPKSYFSYPLVLFFLTYFYLGNIPFLYNYLKAGVDGPTNITLGNELQAVDAICNLSRNQKYNLSVYVPPVIPHSYDYLFDWRTKHNFCTAPATDNTEIIYDLYEVDPPHPERLEIWLQNLDKTATIELTNQFGGIYVQKRQRINNEKR